MTVLNLLFEISLHVFNPLTVRALISMQGVMQTLSATEYFFQKLSGLFISSFLPSG